MIARFLEQKQNDRKVSKSYSSCFYVKQVKKIVKLLGEIISRTFQIISL